MVSSVLAIGALASSSNVCMNPSVPSLVRHAALKLRHELNVLINLLIIIMIANNIS